MTRAFGGSLRNAAGKRRRNFTFFPGIVNSLFASPVYANTDAIIADERFEPAGFALKLGLKDARLALETAGSAPHPCRWPASFADHFLSAMAHGQAEMIGPAWRGCWRATRTVSQEVAASRSGAYKSAGGLTIRPRLKICPTSVFFAGFDVARSLGIILVPLRSFGAVGDDRKRPTPPRRTTLGHVVVVELGPLVAGAVIVRENVTDRKRG